MSGFGLSGWGCDNLGGGGCMGGVSFVWRLLPILVHGYVVVDDNTTAVGVVWMVLLMTQLLLSLVVRCLVLSLAWSVSVAGSLFCGYELFGNTSSETATTWGNSRTLLRKPNDNRKWTKGCYLPTIRGSCAEEKRWYTQRPRTCTFGTVTPSTPSPRVSF